MEAAHSGLTAIHSSSSERLSGFPFAVGVRPAVEQFSKELDLEGAEDELILSISDEDEVGESVSK